MYFNIMLSFFPAYMESGRNTRSRFTAKFLRDMANARVREVFWALNEFPELLYKVELFNGLRNLWAEWIAMGVPDELLYEFRYTFRLVEYVDHSASLSNDAWRDLVIEATISMAVDENKCVGPAYDLDDALVCHAEPIRAVFVAPLDDIPRGNGRYIWDRKDRFPKWTGAVCATP